MFLKHWFPVWSAFREQADLLITTSSGMTIVFLQMNCRFLPTSCVIRTYAVLVLFPSLHQHITRTWLPSEPGIIWWIKNTIGELHSFELLWNLKESRKEMGLFILGSVVSSVSSSRVNLVLALKYIVEGGGKSRWCSCMLLCFLLFENLSAVLRVINFWPFCLEEMNDMKNILCKERQMK